MSFSPVPNFRFHSLCDISPEFLQKNGIRLLLMDLDNTISPYKVNSPSDEMAQWIETMKRAGIRLFIVSNNKGDRPAVFSRLAGIPFLKLARKPSRKGVRRAMELEGAKERETALVGDQIYTDVLAANRTGIKSILVEPILLQNPLHTIRYGLEAPFRFLKRKIKKSKEYGK